MAKAIQKKEYDDSDLDKATKSKLGNYEMHVLNGKEAYNTSVVEIGRYLQAGHGLLAKVGRGGKFTAWVKAKFGFSLSSAENYIAAFRFVGNAPKVGRFINDTALYFLGADSTPEEVGKAAIKLSKKNKPVTLAMAKELNEKYIKKETAKDDDPQDDNTGYGDPVPDADEDEDGDEPEPDPSTVEAESVSPSVPISGAVVKGYDDSIIDALYGKLARALDDKAVAAGGQGNAHAACMADLNEFVTDWENWKKNGGK